MNVNLNLSLSFLDVKELLEKDAFGVSSFARKVKDEVDAFSFAVHSGLVDIRNSPTCPECNTAKTLFNRTDQLGNSYQGLNWKCAYKPGVINNHRVPICNNTWFENTHVSWLQVLELTLHWFLRTPVTLAAGQTGVSNECAVSWYDACREVCYKVVSSLDICIGGPGLHVEIDESHLFKRKYHRGRQLVHEAVWIFGGICRETGEMFVEVVVDRSGATLWPIIQRRIAPGTIILTDSARVYDNLHFPGRGGFEHYQVNHRENFVDPNNPNVYTNTIERQWGLIKGKIVGSLDNEQLDMYLGEYMYRRMYLNVSTDRERRTLGIQFRIFLNDIIRAYPGPCRTAMF